MFSSEIKSKVKLGATKTYNRKAASRVRESEKAVHKGVRSQTEKESISAKA